MKKKVYWGIGIALVAVAIVLGSAQYMIGTNEPLMTEEEVKQVVSSKFAGDILSSELTHANGKETYKVLIEEDAGTYVLFVDAATGKIEQLNQEEKKGDAKQPGDDENKEPISPEEIEQIATREGEGTVETVEYREDDKTYKAIVAKENGKKLEIEIDGMTGKVERTKEIEQVDEKPVSDGQISEGEAKEIALKEFKGTIVDIELDDDDGLLVYEIDMETDSQEGTVVVNAFTGEVESVSIEAQDDDDDD